MLADTGGTSTFETERSKTKRERMEIAIAATASWLTANYDDSKKVWPSLLSLLRGLSFLGGYCIALPVVCFRTGLKGKFPLLSINVNVLMNEKRCCQQ